jgi:hypothetical protein
MCLQACKKGFEFCRPMIFLDGCFLKGMFGGHLLNAVGVDADNSIYPVACAAVESECKASWDWFLELLSIDLGIDAESYLFCFMSDKQKVSNKLSKFLKIFSFIRIV